MKGGGAFIILAFSVTIAGGRRQSTGAAAAARVTALGQRRINGLVGVLSRAVCVCSRLLECLLFLLPPSALLLLLLLQTVATDIPLVPAVHRVILPQALFS